MSQKDIDDAIPLTDAKVSAKIFRDLSHEITNTNKTISKYLDILENKLSPVLISDNGDYSRTVELDNKPTSLLTKEMLSNLKYLLDFERRLKKLTKQIDI